MAAFGGISKVIAEAFLTCALTMPSIWATQPAIEPVGPIRHFITAIRTFDGFGDDITRSHRFLSKGDRSKGNVLLSGGDPVRVTLLRMEGVEAFGALTLDRPYGTKYHAVGDAGALPFTDGVFRVIYWLDQNPTRDVFYAALKDALILLESGGFLVFDEQNYPEWPKLLRHWKYEPLPLVFGRLSIWQKPGEQPRWAYIESQKKKPLLIQFKQKLIMCAA
jgi:hypothetical protein